MLDSHCHLNDEHFDGKVEEFYQKAIANGVKTLLVVGWDVKSSRDAIEIASSRPGVYAAVGVHPENLDGLNYSTLDEIKALSKNPKVVAIGEIGLDYHWYKLEEEHKKQKEWFVKELDLANELGLPVSIHCREAAQDTLDILKTHPLARGGVLHCYSGSTELMADFVKLGLYFGFDGPITYKNAVVPKRNVAVCPADRILSETDAPYLTPVPFRGQTNDSSHIKEIVQEMAFLRGISENQMTDIIDSNFFKLFHVEPIK